MRKRTKTNTQRTGNPVDAATTRPAAPSARDPLAYAAALKIIG